MVLRFCNIIFALCENSCVQMDLDRVSLVLVLSLYLCILIHFCIHKYILLCICLYVYKSNWSFRMNVVRFPKETETYSGKKSQSLRFQCTSCYDVRVYCCKYISLSLK